MKLETRRLLIRPIGQNDKQALFEYRSNKIANKYQGWIPENIEDVESFIKKVSKEMNIPETWFQFVIILKESSKIIGDVGVHFFGKENKQVELGCTIHFDYQQKGFATESLIRVIDYLFKDLNKHRIITSIDPDNSGSISLVEGIGFRKEAHFIESIYLNERWVDDIIYALIKKDWIRINS